MSSDTIICLGVLAIFCIADLAARFYLIKHGRQEDVDAAEPMDVLKDFLEVLTVTANRAIEVVNVDTTKEDYKQQLAKIILDQFKQDLDKFFAGTSTVKAIHSIPDDILVNFIIDHILSLPVVVEKIKNTKRIEQPEQVDMTKYIN